MLAAKRIIGLCLCLLPWQWSVAEQPQPLPEPLTLNQALQLADPGHPVLRAARADKDASAAALDATRADTGVNVDLVGEALYVEPSDVAPDQSHNDSRAGLEVSKKLYDFGVSAAREAASESQLQGDELRLVASRQQHQLQVLERYLDVLLADHQYRTAVEEVVITYVRRDKLRDRHELGQVSDIELLEVESTFAEQDSRRNAARARQRLTRALLGEALGRPRASPRTLAEPDPALIDRELPELNQLLERVQSNNPELLAARADWQASQSSLAASRGGRRPVLTGRVGAYQYEKEFGSRDRWRAGIELKWPLYSGGLVSAEKSRALAQQERAHADLDLLAIQLRERATALWEKVQVLQNERKAALARMDYRELYLDRSRAEYELEVTTDLGDAMAKSTEARQQLAEAEYGLLMTWAELDILQGRWPLAAEEAP